MGLGVLGFRRFSLCLVRAKHRVWRIMHKVEGTEGHAACSASTVGFVRIVYIGCIRV